MGVVERREREKQERRNAILRSAEDLFFRQGYERTRMAEIAEHCELSKGALYLYFANKEDLAKAVVIRSYDILLEMLTANAAQARTGLAKVQAMLQALLTVYHDHYRNFYLTFVLEGHLEGHLFDAEAWQERFERINEIHQLAARVLRQGMNDGSIRPGIDPDLAAMTAMTAAVGFVQRIFRYGDQVAQKRYTVDNLVDEFIAILVNSVT